jgi:hypothetical protein
MTIFCNLTDADGNAFAIIGRVSNALKRSGVSQDEINAYRARAKSGDYDYLIQTSMEVLDENEIKYELSLVVFFADCLTNQGGYRRKHISKTNIL